VNSAVNLRQDYLEHGSCSKFWVLLSTVLRSKINRTYVSTSCQRTLKALVDMRKADLEARETGREDGQRSDLDIALDSWMEILLERDEMVSKKAGEAQKRRRDATIDEEFRRFLTDTAPSRVRSRANELPTDEMSPSIEISDPESSTNIESRPPQRPHSRTPIRHKRRPRQAFARKESQLLDALLEMTTTANKEAEKASQVASRGSAEKASREMAEETHEEVKELKERLLSQELALGQIRETQESMRDTQARILAILEARER
jgi:hypothetical protein